MIQSKHKNYNRAISLLKQVPDENPDNAKICFNISCLYAKEKKIDESLLWLKKAIDKGYNNLNRITNDSDLQSIRNTSKYKRLIQTFLENKKTAISTLDFDTDEK